MRYLRALILCLILFALAGCGQEEQTAGTDAASDDTIVLAAYRQLAPGVNDGY